MKAKGYVPIFTLLLILLASGALISAQEICFIQESVATGAGQPTSDIGTDMNALEQNTQALYGNVQPLLDEVHYLEVRSYSNLSESDRSEDVVRLDAIRQLVDTYSYELYNLQNTLQDLKNRIDESGLSADEADSLRARADDVQTQLNEIQGMLDEISTTALSTRNRIA